MDLCDFEASLVYIEKQSKQQQEQQKKQTTTTKICALAVGRRAGLSSLLTTAMDGAPPWGGEGGTGFHSSLGGSGPRSRAPRKIGVLHLILFPLPNSWRRAEGIWDFASSHMRKKLSAGRGAVSRDGLQDGGCP